MFQQRVGLECLFCVFKISLDCDSKVIHVPSTKWTVCFPRSYLPVVIAVVYYFIMLPPFLLQVEVDYVEKEVSISGYPLSAALTCAKICTSFESAWGVQ